MNREASLTALQLSNALFPEKRATRRALLLRAYVFLWFVRPECLGNPTQVQLAERLKVSKQSVGRMVTTVQKYTGFALSKRMRGEATRTILGDLARNNAPVLAEQRRQAHARRTQWRELGEPPGCLKCNENPRAKAGRKGERNIYFRFCNRCLHSIKS